MTKGEKILMTVVAIDGLVNLYAYLQITKRQHDACPVHGRAARKYWQDACEEDRGTEQVPEE